MRLGAAWAAWARAACSCTSKAFLEGWRERVAIRREPSGRTMQMGMKEEGRRSFQKEKRKAVLPWVWEKLTTQEACTNLVVLIIACSLSRRPCRPLSLHHRSSYACMSFTHLSPGPESETQSDYGSSGGGGLGGSRSGGRSPVKRSGSKLYAHTWRITYCSR